MFSIDDVMSLRTANVYIYIYIFSFTDFLSWYRFNYDVHVVVWLDISITTLQVLLTYANVCSLFILQFCSVLHFRRSIAFGFAFSTPYTLVPRFPPLHFWRCRVFRSRIFSRPVKSKGRPKWIYGIHHEPQKRATRYSFITLRNIGRF